MLEPAHSHSFVLKSAYLHLFLLFCLKVSGTLSETTEGGDGGRWWEDADIVVVAVELCIHKLKWEEGLGAKISKLSYYNSVLGTPSKKNRGW